MYDSIVLTFYNVIFTAAPILLFGLFEQKLSCEKLTQNPYIYRYFKRALRILPFSLAKNSFIIFNWFKNIKEQSYFKNFWICEMEYFRFVFFDFKEIILMNDKINIRNCSIFIALWHSIVSFFFAYAIFAPSNAWVNDGIVSYFYH